MLSSSLLQPPLPPPVFHTVWLGFPCPHQVLSPCSCFRNTKPRLGLMETRFLAAPSPVSGRSQPPCTIFMKAVEFLMKVNAIQVSPMWSEGVGREVWSLSLGYYQRAGAKLQQRPLFGLGEQAVATPDAEHKRERNHYCPEMQNRGQAEYSD